MTACVREDVFINEWREVDTLIVLEQIELTQLCLQKCGTKSREDPAN